MSELSVRMNLLKTHFASLVPNRVVTRKFVDFADRDHDELKAGVFTLLSRGESDYANYVGREADLGRQEVMILGQVVLDDADGEQVEDAEFALLEDVKALARSALPDGISGVLFTGFKQSGQLDGDYGWIVCQLTIK